jgi:outer membrane protein TolC
MINKNYFPIFILFLSSQLSYGQFNFSLSECIDHALKNNPSNHIYDNHISIAKEKGRQALSSYLPQINGTINAINNIDLQTTLLPSGVFGPTEREVQLGTKYNTNAYIDVIQTIFDYSKLLGIKANKPYRELSQLQKEQNIEDIAFSVGANYFQVLIYREQQKSHQSNLSKYQQMLPVLENQVKNGIIIENDLERVKVSLSSTEYQIKDAALKEILALNNLKNAIGIPLEVDLKIKENTNCQSYLDLPSNIESFEVSNLLAVKMGEKQLVLEEFNIRMKKNAFIPTISAIGRFGNQSLSQTLDNAFSNFNNYSYIGLSANVPLFSGLRRMSLLKEEKYVLENNKRNLEINKDLFKLKYQNAQTALLNAQDALKNNENNMKLAKSVYEITYYQYEKGVASLTDFLNDDTAYKNTQSNYLNSLFNLMLSQMSYHKSKGDLMNFLTNIK